MIDCSHGNSEKDPQRQPLVVDSVAQQIETGERTICGVMLESNLREGRQDFKPDLSELKFGVSITDACISWETTEKLIMAAHEQLQGRGNGIPEPLVSASAITGQH